MLCLTLIVFTFSGFLRSVAAVNCPGLPAINKDIQPALKAMVAYIVLERYQIVSLLLLSQVPSSPVKFKALQLELITLVRAIMMQ